MNKGFKNYTKRLTQAVGNVAEVSVNVNKADSNIHITMPLVSTIGKCPIATSLVFDFQSRESTFGFGKGARLNYYALVAGIDGGFQITNSDGSKDEYLSKKKYFNVESGLTLKKVYDNAYGLTYHYEAKDTQGNYMEFAPSGNYPRLIKKANGDKITLDFTSSVKKISNTYGDVVKFNGGSCISEVVYCHNDNVLSRAVISYDTANYIKEITYYNNNNAVVQKLSISITDSQITVRDAISNYRIRYAIASGVVTSIKDGYNDSFERGKEITIATVNGRTTITDKQTGKVSYVVFDSDNFPLYEVDDNGSVVEYVFNKETNQLVFQSHPMHTKEINENIASGVTPTLSNVTAAEVTVTNVLGKKLVGTKAKRYTASSGNGTVIYKISKSGIATDNVTAMVFGKFANSTYNDVPATAILRLMPAAGQLAKGESGAYISNVASGDFDVAIMGVTAESPYSYIQLVINIPEGTSVDIAGVRVCKQECGAFYQYDEQGNITEAVSGNRSQEATYEAGKVTESVGADSNTIRHEYNDENQLVKSTYAYGAKVEYEYDQTHPNNVAKTTVRSSNGNVTLETSRTYTEDGRFIESETDVNGLKKDYKYADQCGNIKNVKDSLSVVTNYQYFDKGLLKEVELTDGSNSTKVKYTYDTKDRISTIVLTNGSKYAFEYDSFDNISVIKLNNVIVFKYEYDSNNRLVRQYYGESSDCYKFTYTESDLIDKIYYVNNGTEKLMYTYDYDTINRVTDVLDATGNSICRYEYDSDGRVAKVIGTDSTIECGYDNLGNVNTKKATVGGKIIAQSFDTVNRSKGSNPRTILESDVIRYDGVFFGMFGEDSNLRNYAGTELPSVKHDGSNSKIATSADNYITCCNIDSSKPLSYELSMKSPYNDECGFVAFCFKPNTLKKQYLFSVKNPNGNGGIYAYMTVSGYVYVYAINSNGEKKDIVRCKNLVKANEWNYFALSFMNRDDGQGYSDVGEYLINLNGCTETVKFADPRIYYNLGTNPVYNIGHNFDGNTATDHFEGSITCLTISPRDYVSDYYLNKHYRTVKDYVIENAIISNEGSIATVDFSDTNLYTTDSDIQNKFKIYPLHNSVKSLSGSKPTVFEHRSVSKNDKDRNFNFNSKIKRYAYVADGFDLRYYFGSANAGTVMMRAYIDVLANRQYFFDMQDTSGNTLGLFRNSSRVVCIDYNGETISTGITVSDRTWHTVGLSFKKDIVSDSTVAASNMDFRVYVDGRTYQVTRNVGYAYNYLRLSVGKSYTSDYISGATSASQESCYNYGPLRGQIEMLATSGAFCEKATLDTLTTELKTYTKVCEFDELGMLRKTEVHCAGSSILSDVITYKENDQNTTQCVAKEKFTHNGTVRTREYATDSYGRVTSVTDSVLGSHTYEYDYRGFLVKENNTTFAYDGNGNITCAGDKVFTYDSVIKDRLMSVDGKAITYSEGNPLNPKTYDGKTFDFEGRRLVKVSSGSMVATYQYDDTGLRTEKTVTKNGVATTTKFVYNGGKLIAEYTGTKRVDYLYDENGMLYGFIYNNAKYFYIRDTLQNILGIVDASGNVVVNYYYSAYGECQKITGSKATTIGVISSFRYKGYYFDAETEFFYCNARYYSPEFCRFICADSTEYLDTGSLDGMNLHCYCNNNPVNKLDPVGNWSMWATVGLVVGVAVCVAAVTILTCGVGTATFVGAVAVGAAKGALIGATIGATVGAGIGYATTETLEGTLEGAAIGLGVGAVVGATTGAQVGAKSWYNAKALEFTNVGSNEVVLGRSPGYVDVAQSRGATYFHTSEETWAATQSMKGVGSNGMWRINKAFLKQQIKSGAHFTLADPASGHFYLKEVAYVMKHGIYTFL